MQTTHPPISWNDLPRIDQVEGFTEADEECLHEIQEVLARHNRLSRFGVALLHQHFHLSPQEVLIEQCDPENRVLTTQPLPQVELLGGYLPTLWRFDGLKAHACAYCPTDKNGNHLGYKDSH